MTILLKAHIYVWENTEFFNVQTRNKLRNAVTYVF